MEVKGAEKLNIFEAMSQAINDSLKTGSIPIVAHKRNRTNFLVTMEATMWIKLALLYQKYYTQNNDN